MDQGDDDWCQVRRHGQDYEHLEIQLFRVQEFNLRVQAVEEKLSTCENLAEGLESVDENMVQDVKEV